MKGSSLIVIREETRAREDLITTEMTEIRETDLTEEIREVTPEMIRRRKTCKGSLLVILVTLLMSTS